MNDETLNRLLNEARPQVGLPQGFQRGVWRRIGEIQTREEARWGWLNDLVIWIARPVPALATCTAALVIGLALGLLDSGAASDEVLYQAYADSINPLAQVTRP